MSLRNFKLALLLAYLFADLPGVAARIASLGLSFALLFFVALYSVLAASLFAVAFIRRTTWRIVIGVIFSAASVLLQSYESVTMGALDYSAFETMVTSWGASDAALSLYGDTLWKTVPVAALLFFALALPVRSKGLSLRMGFGAPVAGLALLSGIFFLRGGEGGRGLPAPFAPLAHGSLMAAVRLSEAGHDRNTVAISPVRRIGEQDVVLIVDESIAPTYLDINNPSGVYSGLGEARPGFAIHNFGYAAAVSNCSAGTNKTLRFGGTRDNYRKVGRLYPSIWAYAHKAGFRTVYLDGQRTGGQLHGKMTEFERQEIDEFTQLDTVAVRDRDQELAKRLLAHLANGQREFIYINKVGAHFPVADKFPDSYTQYKPILPRGETDHIGDMGSIHGKHDGSPAFWRNYRNAYRNTLLWNVGAFWDKVFAGLNPSNAVVVYTSDHGQELHEDGWPGKTTHCINDPRPQEGVVPLVVIDSATKPRLDWTGHLESSRNRQSHFSIFPTVLALLGYDPNDVRPTYGPSLIEPASDPFSFNITYFAALGREPDWRRIDLAKLPMPPVSDSAAFAENQQPAVGSQVLLRADIGGAMRPIPVP